MAVSLSKGQKISLDKEAGTALTHIVMGLGWDPITKKGFFGFGGGKEDVDLDASCLMFDENKELVDEVWFRKLRSSCGSVVHTGDNRTGAGEGDDEQIKFDLARVPANVKSMVVTVNSFLGQPFDKIENATCRLLNGANGAEVAKFNLSAQGPHTAQIMAKVYRHNGEWKMHAIGETAHGRIFQELLPAVLPHL